MLWYNLILLSCAIHFHVAVIPHALEILHTLSSLGHGQSLCVFVRAYTSSELQCSSYLWLGSVLAATMQIIAVMLFLQHVD